MDADLHSPGLESQVQHLVHDLWQLFSLSRSSSLICKIRIKKLLPLS